MVYLRRGSAAALQTHGRSPQQNMPACRSKTAMQE